MRSSVGRGDSVRAAVCSVQHPDRAVRDEARACTLPSNLSPNEVKITSSWFGKVAEEDDAFIRDSSSEPQILGSSAPSSPKWWEQRPVSFLSRDMFMPA